MTDIARLVLEADTKDLRRAKDDLRGLSNEASVSTKSIGQSMQRLGVGLTAGVTAPLATLATVAVKGFVEQERAVADVTAALNSMGAASGKTADELTKTADAMEMRSLFDADVILKQVTANLLTFGNVAGAEFDRAQQAAIDMATRLGGEPQQAAIMLGKALNDPVQGITALTRVGVQFTDQQKEQIKAMSEAGKTAEAQGIILEEVERQFKGAAEAAADATPWRKAEVSIGQAMDKIGGAILPLVGPVTDAIVGLIDTFTMLPEPVQQGVVVFGAVAAAVGPLLLTLSAALPVIKGIGVGIGLLASPLGLVATAVGAVVAAWYYWDEIKAIVSGVGQAISDWFSVNVKPAFDNAMAILQPFTDFFKNVFLVAVTTPLEIIARLLQGDFSGAWKVAQNVVMGAANFMREIVGNVATAISNFMGNMFRAVVDGASNIINSLVSMGRDMITGLVNGIKANASAVWNAIKSVVLSGVEWAKDFLGIASPSKLFKQYGEWVSEGFAIGIENGTPLVEMAAGGLTDALDQVSEKAQTQTVVIQKTFKDMAEGIIGSLQGLGNAIKSGDFLGILGGVLDLFLQIGSTGAFGSGLAARINSAPTHKAMGGSVQAGSPYIVGEQGRELFVPGTDGRIVSNDNMGAQNVNVTVGIDPRSGNVLAFVDGRIAATGPIIANAGAQQAQAQMARSGRRRVR